jgi:hypothetical protein
MGLITHALAFGAGYAVGRPDGRQRLVQLKQQATELAGHPQVRRQRERSWDFANGQVLAAKRRMDARSRGAGSTGGPSRGWRRLRRYPDDTGATTAADTGRLPVPPPPAPPAAAIPPSDRP